MCHKNLSELLEKLERNCELVIHWFKDNYMNLSTGKCHLLISDHKYEHQLTQIENKVKILGITIDNELTFDAHILNICLKAYDKIKYFM